MKKALKVIIPLVLVLALLAACWFFLFHRPDMTSGYFESRAAHMASRGRYERAIRYYSWAWKLDASNEGLPLSLAQTYVAAGNYTKAEYTLVKAISAAPGNAQLYIALCQTYVEQDKLLDAVQMLDRITDEGVKATLDEFRPAAPTISPESGYYSEYIDVTVETPENRLYVTTNGEYPSMERDLYAGPVPLKSGESTVIAIAVNDMGLVSPVIPSGYTIGGVVEPVELSDPSIDAAVREQLGLSASATLMSDALWGIVSLELPNTVEDLSDLRYCTGLRSLTLENVSGMDFSVLEQLTSLEQLNLSNCTISSNSLDAISSLVNLRRLELNTCGLTDITPLGQLTKLTELDLSNNSITDLSVLSLMLELETVSVANNPVTSIAGLATCSKLKSVDISNCNVASLSSLSDKANLEIFLAPNNQISDLSDLAGCRALSVLNVEANQVADISVLAKLNNLTRFYGNSNLITTVPDFDEDRSILQIFSVNNNQIADISGLADLAELNYVYADYNQIQDLSSLAVNRNLIQVDVWDNPLTEESVKALQEASVIVNFNPNYEPPVEESDEEEGGEDA